MARGRKNAQAARNRRRSRRGRQRSSRAMSSAVPRQLITSNTRRISIPWGTTVAGNLLRMDLGVANIMTYGPNSGLSFEYRQIKIHRVRVYWQSDNGTSDSGSVCLIVCDYGENKAEDVENFDEICTAPGAMVRKVWQNVSNVWFPTEPTDRDYHDVDYNDGICTITVRHSKPDGKLDGRLLAIIDASFRGRSIDRCKKALALLAEASRSVETSFEQLEVA